MRRSYITAAAFAAVLTTILGCGGDGSSKTESNSNTKLKGYYVDEVIVGVSYDCASTSTAETSGVTDENGTFEFYSGQSCSFSVGGIVVENTPQLTTNHVVITENDPDDLGYLLTLDNDANPANGINILPSVANEAQSYNTQNGNTVPADIDLDGLSSTLTNNAVGYGGTAVEGTQVGAQVANASLAACVRGHIGGTTWYAAKAGSNEVVELIFNAPVTSVIPKRVHPTIEQNPPLDIFLTGLELWTEDDGHELMIFRDCDPDIGTNNPPYLTVEAYEGTSHADALSNPFALYRWFDNQSDAVAYAQ